MTEFEMANLLNDMIGTGSNMFLNWISMVTAFLVVGYFASHRLDRWMVATVVVAYSYTFQGMVAPMFSMIANIQGLARKMEAFAQGGSGLDWHAVKTVGLAPPWFFSATDAVNVAVFAAVYVASLVFFFRSRRANRATEAGAAKPAA